MSKTILVIDDDQVDREAIRRAVSRPGRNVTVREAETGEEGMRLMREGAYDCIFLDYLLPDMDGISLLRRLYDPDSDVVASPVVMLTGQGNEAVMADALRWGAQDYLVKNNISVDTLAVAMAKAHEIFELKKSRRRAEELLRQSQKMEAVGQLTSGVAHDFNNLLTVIMGNTRLLQKRLEENGRDISKEDFEKKLNAINSAAKKGADLVRRLMVFTRQRSLQREIVQVNDCIAGIHELLKRSLSESIEMKTRFGEDLWPVKIDCGQFEHALINIAVNARDAMGKGGSLTIETKNAVLDEEYVASHPEAVPGAYVMTAISDTGKGMPESVRSRIFEPFYTTKPPGEGTGLGLSMVYGFIKQSGGHIYVYSEEGHGTVFRIYLPRYQEEKEKAENKLQDPSVLSPGNETILLVEDDDRVRQMAGDMLERLGYKTLAAPDGRTALEIFKRRHREIDLIFTDIVMKGGLNGTELVAQARAYHPGIRVLYASGYTENTLADYRLGAGQDVIEKPYRKEDLARRLRQILGEPGKRSSA